MSEVDWKKAERGALAEVARTLRGMSKMPSNVVTKREAARRLGIPITRLVLLIRLDLLDTVEVGRNELVILL